MIKLYFLFLFSFTKKKKTLFYTKYCKFFFYITNWIKVYLKEVEILSCQMDKIVIRWLEILSTIESSCLKIT